MLPLVAGCTKCVEYQWDVRRLFGNRAEGKRLNAGCIITIIQLRWLSGEAIGAGDRDTVIRFPLCCYSSLSLDPYVSLFLVSDTLSSFLYFSRNSAGILLVMEFSKCHRTTWFGWKMYSTFCCIPSS